jgi:hypothetical protein
VGFFVDHFVKHHVRGRSDLGRRLHPLGAVCEQRLGLGAGAAVHRQIMPGRQQVPRDRLSHYAQPDESDSHACFARFAFRR